MARKNWVATDELTTTELDRLGLSALMTGTSQTRDTPQLFGKGQLFYEVDTRRLMIYDGTDWRILSSPWMIHDIYTDTTSGSYDQIQASWRWEGGLVHCVGSAVLSSSGITWGDWWGIQLPPGLSMDSEVHWSAVDRSLMWGWGVFTDASSPTGMQFSRPVYGTATEVRFRRSVASTSYVQGGTNSSYGTSSEGEDRLMWNVFLAADDRI